MLNSQTSLKKESKVFSTANKQALSIFHKGKILSINELNVTKLLSIDKITGLIFDFAFIDVHSNSLSVFKSLLGHNFDIKEPCKPPSSQAKVFRSALYYTFLKSSDLKTLDCEAV